MHFSELAGITFDVDNIDSKYTSLVLSETPTELNNIKEEK